MVYYFLALTITEVPHLIPSSLWGALLHINIGSSPTSISSDHLVCMLSIVVVYTTGKSHGIDGAGCDGNRHTVGRQGITGLIRRA